LDDIHKDLAAMRKDREKAEKEAMYGKEGRQAVTQHFPLSEAAYCESCGEVGGNLSACACCGSRAILGLATILNRDADRPGEYALEAALWAVEREQVR
jgi:hypothetical protein